MLAGIASCAFAANPTTTVLTVSTNAARLGQTVTLTATVASPSSGNVTFYDGATVVGIGAVKNGVAVVSTAALASGVHRLQARYDGDANDAKSLSGAVSVAVQSLPAINFFALPVFGSTTVSSGITADLNNDHIPDLITIQQDASVTVYLGNGDGTFAAGTSLAVNAIRVASGDFNGDGNVDLAFIASQADTLTVFLGNGDGTFASPTTIAVPGDGNLFAIAAADFNGDGLVDLLVSRNQSVAMLPGNGDGTFGTALVTEQPEPDIVGLVVGDFNGDGKPDVITVSSEYSDHFAAGNGDGTFAPGVDMFFVSYSLAAADLNGDGKLDLISEGDVYGNVVLLGNGDGTFGTPLNLDFGYTGVADVNGDGKLDLVSATNYAYGNGDGTFQPTVSFAPMYSYNNLVAVADVNNNGQVDLITEGSAGISVLLGTDVSTVTLAVSPLPATYGSTVNVSATVTPASGTGTVTFYDGGTSLGSAAVVNGSAALSIKALYSGHRVYSAQYSGDNVTRAASSAPVEVLVLGTPTTLSMTASPANPTYGQVLTLTATIAPNAASGLVTFYDGGNPLGTAALKSGTATFSTITLQTGAHSLTAQYDGGGSYSASSFGMIAVTVSSLTGGRLNNPAYLPGSPNDANVYSTDLNNDGKPDLMVTTATSLSIYLGTGSGTFGSPNTYPLQTLPTNVFFGDFNNDGFADVVLQTATSLIFMLGNGDGTVRPGMVLAISQENVGVSDVNGDGNLDLVLASTSMVTVLLGNGDGSFQPPLAFNSTYSLASMAIADVNGDGKPDLIFGASLPSASFNGVLVYLGNGDGAFSAPIQSAQVTGPTAIAVGDLNRDGKLDLVISASQSFVSLLGDGTGKFTVAENYTDGTVVPLMLADINGDGILDIVGGLDGLLQLFTGNGDGTFSPATLNNPYTDIEGVIALGDFFQTGRVSIAAGIPGNGVALYAGVRPSTAVLSGNPNPGTLGQPVTLSATITPSDATGSVTFYLASNNLGTSPVVGGVATLTTSTLAANRQVIMYSYSGDAITAPSSYYSDTYYIETITGLHSSLSLSSSASTLTFGRPLLLTATISPAAATGVVTFFAGTQILGSANLNSGVATLSSSFLPAGKSQVRAVYEGSNSYTAGITSNELAIQINTVAGSTFNYVPTAAAFNVTALAAGDFNGDGIQDLVVRNYNANNLELLLGHTDGTFTVLPGPFIWPYSNSYYLMQVVAVDLNGDGKLDLVLPGNYDVNVNPGNGDGTFGQPIYTGFTAQAMASSDFDGNGIPDLILMDVSNKIQVLRGVGDGTFLPLTDTAAPGTNDGYSAFIVSSDFNGDGKADIAVAGYDNNAVSIFLGNGDGTFQAPSDIPLGTETGQMAATDLNGDGVPDLAVISGTTGNLITVLIGKGDGTFQAPVSYPGIATGAGFISASDFNGDGHLDIVVTGFNGTAVLYGNGDGTLQSASVTPEGALGSFVTDYNGDGRADLPTLLGAVADTIVVSAVTSGETVTLTASVTPAAATGIVTFYNGATVLGNVPVVNGVSTLTTQLPANGLQQITAKYLGDSNYAYVTSASVPVTISGGVGGTFTGPLQFPAGASPSAIVTADFNHDGKLDLAVANANENTVSVLWGSGDGTFGTSSTYATGANPIALASGDFNGDGIPDIAIANAGSNNLTILLSNQGSLVPGVAVPVSYSPFAIAAGDLNGDGRMDLVITGGNVGESFPLFGNGDGTFTPSPGSPLITGSSQLVLNDFNNDRLPDVLLGSSSEYLGDGHGNFSEETIYGTSSGIVTAADFNHDGNLDIAVASYPNPGVSVLLGKGDGSFSAAGSYPTPTGPIYLATGDFNGDGITDIVLVNSSGTVGLMIGNGDGSFQPEIAFLAGTQPTAIAVGDFNGDGRLDMAVPNAGSNNVSILLGAASACTFTVSPTSFIFDEAGGSATVSVTANAPGCQWSANLVQGYNLYGSESTANGVGSGSFSLMIPPNNEPGGSPASATIDVANQMIPVIVRETAPEFADVPASAYYFDAVNLLKEHNITAGCGSNDFCPQDTVTRAEMAIFIVRGILGTDNFTYTLTPYFTDVPPDAFGFQWIQKLKDLGITGGCGVNLFCPDDSVTRSQAAVFLIRARYGSSTLFPYSPTPYFTDVPTGEYAFPWIQRMQEDSITAGCTPTTYCPDSSIIRGDMAIFIMRALFNQLLPSNEPVVFTAAYNAGPNPVLFISGTNTHFVQGTTQVTVPGLIIGTVMVTGPTDLSAFATRDASVPAGPESVVAITGQEVAVGPNLLNLQ